MILADFLNRLKNVQGTGGQYSARCPAHDDNRNSLSVSVGADNRIICHCFAGCTVEDIVDRMGLTMRDLFADMAPGEMFPTYKPESGEAVCVAEYIYHTTPPIKKLRMRNPDGSKRFYWQHQEENDWKTGRGKIEPTLFTGSAQEIPAAVYFVEGEKDVLTLEGFGFPAVSLADGAKSKWRDAYSDALRGRAVYIIPDNDEPGREYGAYIAGRLQGVASMVRMLDLRERWPEIPEHGDISDMAEALGAETALKALAELTAAAKEYKLPSGEHKPRLMKSSDVPYEPPRWTVPPYFQRGKGTLVQGDNGTGKTAFLCAVAAHVSTGRPILDIPVTTPGNVILMSVEDDLPVLRGRLEADGGDLDKCYLVSNAAGLSFNDPKVESMIRKVSAKMIIFDPLQAFLGAKIDMFRSNETRPALAKLFEMCERNDCACVIIAHMGKYAGDKSPVNRALGSVDIPAAMRSIIQIVQDPENEYEKIAVHVKCSNAPKGQSIKYTIGERGGVTWLGYSPITVEDVEALKKRQERKEQGIPYEQEPLVQVFNQLITDKPGGGFWSYTELKKASMLILGFEAYGSITELRQRLDGGLSKELLKNDGLIVTHGEKGRGHTHGIRIQRFRLPEGYQEKIPETEAG